MKSAPMKFIKGVSALIALACLPLAFLGFILCIAWTAFAAGWAVAEALGDRKL